MPQNVIFKPYDGTSVMTNIFGWKTLKKNVGLNLIKLIASSTFDSLPEMLVMVQLPTEVPASYEKQRDKGRT
jgi:hypothetical protein